MPWLGGPGAAIRKSSVHDVPWSIASTTVPGSRFMWWTGSGPTRSVRMSRTSSGRTTNATDVPGGAWNGAVGELTASTVRPRQAISMRSGAVFTITPRTTLRSPISRATVSEAGRANTSAFGPAWTTRPCS